MRPGSAVSTAGDEWVIGDLYRLFTPIATLMNDYAVFAVATESSLKNGKEPDLAAPLSTLSAEAAAPATGWSRRSSGRSRPAPPCC